MSSLSSLQIRVARPGEYEPLGELTLAAYASVDPSTLEGDYPDELRDVAGRAAGADVLVAIDGAGLVRGGVTYVPGPESPSAEFSEPDAAGIRMLAVDPAARGRGVGEALARACIDRARAAGRQQVLLHSTDRMTVAHRLYRRLGFVHDPSLDWEPEPGVNLRGFRLRLDGPEA
jgi:ribosomal protein S18 acetylase RimI-like enzyme